MLAKIGFDTAESVPSRGWVTFPQAHGCMPTGWPQRLPRGHRSLGMGLRGAKPATSSPFGRQEKLAQMKARLSREYPEIADPSRDGEVRPPDLRIRRRMKQ